MLSVADAHNPSYARQDEERDSSDEEWDLAYAVMDPISQLRWGNRCNVVEGVTTTMVRDVFLAADMLHEDSMSEVGGSTHGDDESGGNAEGDGDDSSTSSTNSSMGTASSDENEEEGEHMVKCMSCTALVFAYVAPTSLFGRSCLFVKVVVVLAAGCRGVTQ